MARELHRGGGRHDEHGTLGARAARIQGTEERADIFQEIARAGDGGHAMRNRRGMDIGYSRDSRVEELLIREAGQAVNEQIAEDTFQAGRPELRELVRDDDDAENLRQPQRHAVVEGKPRDRLERLLTDPGVRRVLAQRRHLHMKRNLS